ncbi:MAG: NAD(P)/FAD-dependent oxidoreductase [Silvibacterium sp.]
MHLENQEQAELRHVIIVGGGFAGLKCATELAPHSNVRITLIDRNNYQQFQPLLYQVATSALSPTNAAFAFRDIFRSHDNVDVQMDDVVSVNLSERSVTTASGKKHQGDFLVLATGSHVNFYGTPGAEQHTFPLYTLQDAETLRSTILKTFEAADHDPEKSDGDLLNFVVVGGGPTGVEMAGNLSDMLQRVFKREFRHVGNTRPQVFLIEMSQSVLGTFAPASQSYAVTALREHGVDVRLGVAVTEVTPDAVTLSDGSRIPTKTVVWAAGLKAAAPPQSELSRLSNLSNGRVEVEADLSVRGLPGVYILGDLANSLDDAGKALPQLAAVAKQAGEQCARNILAAIAGKPSRPFVYSDRGTLAMIGRNAAVAELGKTHHQLVGPIAFAAWLGVHAVLLTAARARLEAIVEWAWEYFTGEHPSQLIDR